MSAAPGPESGEGDEALLNGSNEETFTPFAESPEGLVVCESM